MLKHGNFFIETLCKKVVYGTLMFIVKTFNLLTPKMQANALLKSAKKSSFSTIAMQSRLMPENAKSWVRQKIAKNGK